MKTHKWIPHVVVQARTVPVETLPGALRTDPLVQAARGILILALALGSIGAESAASSGYASAHQAAGNVRLAESAYPVSSRHVIPDPFMY
jgi:hypothetical protein